MGLGFRISRVHSVVVLLVLCTRRDICAVFEPWLRVHPENSGLHNIGTPPKEAATKLVEVPCRSVLFDPEA